MKLKKKKKKTLITINKNSNLTYIIIIIISMPDGIRGTIYFARFLSLQQYVHAYLLQ